jgi:hypothetical protein
MLELHGMNLISSLPQEPLPIYLDRRNNRPAGRSAGDRGISSGDDAMALSDYFLHHRDVIPVSPSGRAEQRSRPGLLRRLLDALVASRLQQTEHEIARYLESTGGKLTDTVEREIEERLYPHRRV